MEGICNILIIDDCEEDREVYRRYLMQGHPLDSVEYQISTTESAEEALDRCQTESFDVILLDYDLPELTGLEFLAGAQAQGLSDVAIIMLSAFGNESLAVRALEARGAGLFGQEFLDCRDSISFHSLVLRASSLKTEITAIPGTSTS